METGAGPKLKVIEAVSLLQAMPKDLKSPVRKNRKIRFPYCCGFV
jgi:hypothetical protein